MTVMRGSRRVRHRVVTALVAALMVAGPTSCATSQHSRPGATDASTGDGWKAIEYEGVQVDIPAGWTRTDVQDCEFQFERWAPPDLRPCGPDGGVSFYPSATFDPKYGPGIRHDDRASDPRAWAGYVLAGDFAIYVVDDDRDLVHDVLASAEPSGE
jgi:hypothetical protein